MLCVIIRAGRRTGCAKETLDERGLVNPRASMALPSARLRAVRYASALNGLNTWNVALLVTGLSV